jgi:hypothetical protein
MPARIAETRNAFVVIGGMLAASFIAVFLIPVLFYLVEKFMGKKKEPKPLSRSGSRLAFLRGKADLARRRRSFANAHEKH